MSKILERLEQQLASMSKQQQKLGQYVLANKAFIFWKTANEIAQEAGVSISTVTRFCQANGFESFYQFKLVIADENKENDIIKFALPESPKFKQNIAENILRQHIAALIDTAKITSENKMKRAAHFIHQAEVIMCAGIGASKLVAEDLLQKLLRMEKKALSYSDLDLQKVALSQYTHNDLLVVISYSGKKQEIIQLAKQAKAQNVPILAITSVGTSPLAKLATLTLEVAAYENIVRFSALSSRMTQLYLVDILFYTYTFLFQPEAKKTFDRTYHKVQHKN